MHQKQSTTPVSFTVNSKIFFNEEEKKTKLSHGHISALMHVLYPLSSATNKNLSITNNDNFII